MSGRTLGMTLLGLRVVRDDGSGLDGKHAIVRVLAFPLSILTLGIGFLLILLRRDRCALHDLIADTAVVYDWNLRRRRTSTVSPSTTLRLKTARALTMRPDHVKDPPGLRKAESSTSSETTCLVETLDLGEYLRPTQSDLQLPSRAAGEAPDRHCSGSTTLFRGLG